MFFTSPLLFLRHKKNLKVFVEPPTAHSASTLTSATTPPWTFALPPLPPADASTPTAASLVSVNQDTN